MSIKIEVYNQKAEPVSELKLADKIFAVPVKQDLVHQAVVAQMANMRQVLANTKDRSEVRGGGKKPWKQKGTGRARAGSSRSPIWIGGGVTFGPLKERNFSLKINIKMKRKALFMVLSDKVAVKNIIVLDKLEMADYKTKVFAGILDGLDKVFEKNAVKDEAKSRRSVLIIESGKDEKVKYSGRNLNGVKIINLSNINILDLLKYKKVITTVEVIQNLEKVYKIS